MTWKSRLLELVRNPPEFLRLNHDQNRAGFAGRYVIFKHEPYAIGQLIGEGDEAMVYELVRLRAGYFSEVVKICRYPSGHPKYSTWASAIRDETNPHSQLPEIERQSAELVRVEGGCIKIQTYISPLPETDWKSVYPVVPILRYLYRDDSNGALAVTDELLQKYGEIGALLEHKGLALTNLGRLDEAREALEHALEAHTAEGNTARLTAAYNLSRVYALLYESQDESWLELKDGTRLPMPQLFSIPEEAAHHVDFGDRQMTVLLEILTIEPFFVPALVDIAHILGSGGHLDAYEAVVTALKRIDPSHPKIERFESGLASWKAAVIVDALPMPESVRQMNERFDAAYADPEPERGKQAEARFQEGVHLLFSGQLEAAAKQFIAASNLDRTDVRYPLGTCRVLLAQNDYSRALEQLKALREVFPGEPDIYHLEGLALARLDRSGEAMKAYRKALACVPEVCWPIELELSKLYREDGQTAKAVELLRSSWQENPDQPDIALAFIYALRHEMRESKNNRPRENLFVEAKVTAAAAADRFTTMPEFHVAKAQLAIEERDVEDALRALHRAVELDSDHHTIAAQFLSEINAWQSDQ